MCTNQHPKKEVLISEPSITEEDPSPSPQKDDDDDETQSTIIQNYQLGFQSEEIQAHWVSLVNSMVMTQGGEKTAASPDGGPH